MVFSSPVFLFAFLPLTLLCFFAVPVRARTPTLFGLSLCFYAWTEGTFVFALLLSIGLNWLFALLLDWTTRERRRRLLVGFAVALNIGALLWYKYCNFVVANLRGLAERFSLHPIPQTDIRLPVGISFITFEALSYVIDVYRRHTRARRNPIDVGFYVSFFPHLIAGPILRFDDVAGQIGRPMATAETFASGVRKFIMGLGKKLLIANSMGRTADAIFSIPDEGLSTSLAWLGIVSYALQIYFDFSGYTDMAIGLGRLFGFELPKNFDLPYASRSMRDFWRRWHISLSTWFRDYLYIPLGGNRGSVLQSYRNLIIVFLVCGLWHGASWTFVVWGAYHGAFLILERTPVGRWVDTLPRPLQHAYAVLAILVGWVFFRAESFGQAASFIGAMAGRGAVPSSSTQERLLELLDREVVLTLALAIPLATLPVADWLRCGRRALEVAPKALGATVDLGGVVLHMAVFLLCAMYLAAGTYNPFIYFRF